MQRRVPIQELREEAVSITDCGRQLLALLGALGAYMTPGMGGELGTSILPKEGTETGFQEQEHQKEAPWANAFFQTGSEAVAPSLWLMSSSVKQAQGATYEPSLMKLHRHR